MTTFDFDLITIGAGSGGVRAARLAGGYGARVAIVENSRVGGTCVMRGCVPKKLLVIASAFGPALADALGYGWSVDGARLDWGRLIERKNAELDRLEAVYRRLLATNNVTLIEGTGRLVGPHEVEVDGRRVSAEKILLATGGWPDLPAIPGIELAITSNEALDLPSLPQSLIVVGGGYIAVEFASLFAAAGATVTIVYRGNEILRGFDDDVRQSLAEALAGRGIAIDRRRRISALEPARSGVRAILDDGRTLEAEVILYATGRRPNTANLNLAGVGVATDERGAVRVDDWNRSSVPSIFAVGDVTNRINLTPVAIAEGRAFAETFFNSNPTQVDYSNVPSAVFSQPPVACVGLTEAEAAARGPVQVFVSRFKPMRHALSGRDERTMMKLVVDAVTDRVLGCHMVGDDAPEILQGFAVALQAGARKADFDRTIGIHPTAAEEFVTMREARPALAAAAE
jgi:glutathione reductase (NADPH)